MRNLHVIVGVGESPSYPAISVMPTHVLFLGVLYPLIGLLPAFLTLGYEVAPPLFPLASGFALVGPFAAMGLYELSRRREQGLDSSWTNAFDVVRSPSRDALLALGFLLMAIFLIWLATAELLYRSLFGYTTPESIPHFVRQVFTTPAGWTLIVVGNAIGFVFAVIALTISVVSFPLLLDREVGAAVASNVGPHRRGCAGAWLGAAVPRSGDRHADPRARDLASLSQGSRAGPQP